MATHLSLATYAAAALVFAVLAMVIHHFGDRILGQADSKRLVWDELAGYLLAMFAIGWSWKVAIIGFFLERALDIAKVPPANYVDRRWHSGFGVVLDDLIAGAYTCAVLHVLINLWPALAG